jgi:PAS domain S-box-containing protein
MTLQNKTLLALSFSVVATIAAIYVFSGIIVSDSFQELENSYARDNIEKVMEALDNELDHLASLAEVHSQLVTDVATISAPSLLAQLRAMTKPRYHLAAIYNSNGVLVPESYYEPGVASGSAFPPPWQSVLNPDNPLYIPRGSDGRARGLIRTPDGQIMMLASATVNIRINDSVERGTLLLGRMFDAEQMQGLSRVSRMSIRMIDLETLPEQAEQSSFYKSLTISAPYQVRIRDESTINGFILLKDTRGRPAFVLEASLPRDIYNQGQATLSYFTKLLFIAGVVSVVIVGLLMNQLVLARLARLGRGIARIHETGDLSERVSMDGNDEFRHLAGIFNKLLAGLHTTRSELEQQISVRHAAEQDLQKSQELYQRAEAIGKLGHWEWDEVEGRMLACSEQYALIYGMTVPEVLERFCSRMRELEYVHVDDRSRVQTVLELATEQQDRVDIEYRITGQDGITRHVHRNSEPVTDTEGQLVRSIGTLQDITRQKQAQERLELYQKRLRVLMSELALVEEQERRRIAAGLHDSTIQNLGLSKFKLFVFQNSLPENISRDTLNEVIETIDMAIRETRTLVFELSPPILYELGFIPAVEWLAEQVFVQRGLVCKVYCDKPDITLDKTVMVILFQMVRELLVNIAKHACASSASIRVASNDDRISIEVTDNGKGFDPGLIEDSMSDLRGFGLFSIRERLGNMGEQLVIESAPDQGTRITFSVPVKLDIEVLS